jgi:hypothetical protein
MLRDLVIRARVAEHDHPAVELHVHVGNPSLALRPAPGLREAERRRNPGGCTTDILTLRQHHYELGVRAGGLPLPRFRDPFQRIGLDVENDLAGCGVTD